MEMSKLMHRQHCRTLGYACVVLFVLSVVVRFHYVSLDIRDFVGIHRPTGSQSRLCVHSKGRLGNTLFSFASMFGIARTKGMVPFIENSSRLVEMFELQGLVIVHNKLCNWFRTHREVRNAAFDRATVDFTNATDIALYGYYQSWRYFKDSEAELREKLRIKPELRKKAREKLEASVSEQLGIKPPSGKGEPPYVYVGVHVRRGDYLAERPTAHGTVVAPKGYLQHATDFFRSKFPRAVFVVCSDDVRWCRENLIGRDVVFIEGQSAELDLTTLTLCDHTIVTVGTFGWWAAWLTNGLTVYYKHQYRDGSRLAQEYHLPDFFPPQWISMG